MNVGSVFDEKGNIIILGEELSTDYSGGEGQLFRVKGHSNLVAKIFRDNRCEREKHEKLLKMLKNPPAASMQKPNKGKIRIAWPTSILYRPGGKRHDECVGFLMPFFEDTFPLDCLISGEDLEENGLDALDLPVVAAYNLASIMTYLHNNHYVVGDISSDNFMVDKDGAIYAVDTDSYQFEGTRCTVNHKDYCPKEYLDDMESNRPVQFTVEGDRFGLAKLIFQLLMNGFDAHAGIGPYHHDAIEIHIQCVKKGIFPYHNDKGYTPSPHAPSYAERLPEAVRYLFERCFCDGAFLPTARPHCGEWVTVLKEYYNSFDSEIKVDKKSIRGLNDSIARNPSSKILPVILCLDISESMKQDGRIDKLNRGLGDLINSLKSHHKAKNMVELEIIVFGGPPKVYKSFTPIRSVYPPRLNAIDGHTPLYQTLQTAIDELNRLRKYSPAIDYIIKYRELSKLDSTYAVGLKRAIKSDSRIHTTFTQAMTNTGRLSSTEPNLQNIPVRTEEGSRLREAFTAEEGKILVDADYSQIELRLLAALSGDEVMCSAFNEGEDIHKRTAAKIYGVTEDMVTHKMRATAKTVNFSIIYGISDYGLATDLGIGYKEAAELIKEYNNQFPGVTSYLEMLRNSGEEKGYAVTMYGRKRVLNELKSQNRNIKNFGYRAAMNTPIQGTAADIIKIAMNRVIKALEEKLPGAKLVMQVHDELICECDINDKDLCASILKSEMEAAASLSVPLLAEVGFGKDWLEAK